MGWMRSFADLRNRGKVQIHIWLTPEISLNLRNLIQNKYGKYQRGLLSFEVEEALRNWMALHTSAQNTLVTKAPNPNPRVMRVWIEVKRYLLANYYEELHTGSQVQRRHVENAIMNVRGKDPRTMKTWLKAFYKMELIKPIAGEVWEIL
jgi:hypothetical protein